jgi:hypothetical protein
VVAAAEERPISTRERSNISLIRNIATWRGIGQVLGALLGLERLGGDAPRLGDLRRTTSGVSCASPRSPPAGAAERLARQIEVISRRVSDEYARSLITAPSISRTDEVQCGR